MNERRTDFELLRDFAMDCNQEAFAALARRHVDLVYGTALRKVEDRGAADEVTQSVFFVLARKAWRFGPGDSLPAWLYKAALLESREWVRGELRRRRREQTAAELGTTMKNPDEQSAFRALLPLLDEALLSLREKHRTALLLRYHENLSLREVGVSLGVGEDAAQKRVAAALGEVARFFQRRGFRTASVSAASAALHHTAAAAPASTVASVTHAALGAAPPMFFGSMFLGRLAALTGLQKGLLCVMLFGLALVWRGSREMDGVADAGAPAANETVPLREAPVPQESVHRGLIPIAEASAPGVDVPVQSSSASYTIRLSGIIALPEFKAATLEVSYSEINVTGRNAGARVRPAITAQTNYLMLQEGQKVSETIRMDRVTFDVLQVETGDLRLKVTEGWQEHEYRFESVPGAIPAGVNGETNVIFQNVRLLDVVGLHGLWVKRTVLLHPAVDRSPFTAVISAGDLAAAATAMERAFKERGVVILPCGDKFELVVPVDLAKAMAGIAAPDARSDRDILPAGTLHLNAMGLEPLMQLYGELIGRTWVRRERIADAPVFDLWSVTALTRTEAIFALDTLLRWNGLRARATSGGTFRLERIDGQ